MPLEPEPESMYHQNLLAILGIFTSFKEDMITKLHSIDIYVASYILHFHCKGSKESAF